MKRHLAFIVILLMFQETYSQTYNFMTYNIRLDVKSDGINQWENRKDKLCDLIKYYEPEICGLQEALFNQITDMETRLPAYAYVGQGRDDGLQKGEFSCIFYKKNAFEVLKTKTLWLNEHPETVGFGWDAKINRIMTYALLKDKKTKQKFYVFNTHFDHQGQIARRESAKLLVKWANEIAGNTPLVLMGDFNAIPEEEPIQILNAAFQNTKNLSLSPHFGPLSSFNGFGSKEQEGREIDIIFLKNWKGRVLKHATISQTWAGLYASDHHPVMVTLEK